jgi:hypothetical protein
MLNPLELAQRKVEERARAKRDKLYLANEVLGYDFCWETHAELFACYTQYKENAAWVEQDDVKNRLILWSRGHFKTTAIVVEVVQAILNFPNIRVLLMQGNIKLTKTLLKQIKSHFLGEADGSRLKELFPEFCGTAKELGPEPTFQFTVPCRTQKQLAQATVTVASPKSIKTGQHYDLAVFDDLVTDQNFRNPAQLEKVTTDFTLAQALVDPGCYRLVSGTRYAFGDTYEQIIRWHAQSGGWIISVKDCWTDNSRNLPDAEKKPRFPRFTKKNGELGGFTTEELLQMQSNDPANFTCQYLNQPLHRTHQAFTNELWESVMIPASEVPALSQPIMMVDLASGDSIYADDSVIGVGKVDSLGVCYLCDLRGNTWLPTDLALNVIDMAIRHRPTKICFENTAPCKYFVETLRLIARQKNIYLPIELVKVDNQDDAKNIRVLTLAGMLKRNRFKVLRGIPKLDVLIKQSCQFPKGKKGHDDYIDVAALLYRELANDLFSLPIKQPARHPILALMADRENALIKTLTETELQAVNVPDSTGLD